jgi:hypothetical protein
MICTDLPSRVRGRQLSIVGPSLTCLVSATLWERWKPLNRQRLHEPASTTLRPLLVVHLAPLLPWELTSGHEPDGVLLSVDAQHPGNFLHVAEGGLAPVGVAAAGRDGKRDTAGFAVEQTALDNLVAQFLSADDGGVPAGEAEAWLVVASGSGLDLETHEGTPYEIR